MARGLFYKKPRHPTLARIITFQSVAAAKRAASELVRMFRRARTREYKRAIKSATVLAANRARASLRRRNLHPAERKKLREIARIYRAAAEEMVIPPKRR